MNMRNMDELTITNTCFRSLKGIYTSSEYFVTVLNRVMQLNTFSIDIFEQTTFAFMKILEFFYPVSYFCSYTPFEVADLYSDFSAFGDSPG